jgi:REP element-mobilizing transposase RayT
MTYDPSKHHRRSIRHPDHDYRAPGAYFVTVCTKWRECALEDPALAAICREVWYALPQWFPTIALDEFVVMPNHVHFIVWLGVDDDSVGTGLVSVHLKAPDGRDGDREGYDRDREGRPYHDRTRVDGLTPWDWEIAAPQSQRADPALGDVVGSWKSLITNTYLNWIKKHDLHRQAKFWQRNYYDRIVRDDRALGAIRRYIRANPARWALDPDNAKNVRGLPFPETVDDYFDDVKRQNHPGP